MRETVEKIKDFLIIGVAILVVLSLFESDGSGSSSPEYQEEMYIAQKEALIEDHIEEQKYQEYENAENAWEYEPIYFLPNGYYYHSTKECKGLEGCYNIQEDIFGNISEYRHLDACKWCN